MSADRAPVRGNAAPGSDAEAVEFDRVGAELGGHRVLDRLSLRLARGELLVLLGRSGSGKSTSLRLVNRLVEPSDGEVRVGGRPTTAWDLIELRRHLGYVIQEIGLFPHFTVRGNIELVPRLLGWPAERRRARVTALMELIGLPEDTFAERYPRALSGGQQQRVGVARALAADPDILLCDEPFGALDPITRAELQQEFLSLRNSLGKSILFVTHDVREALLLGDRVALLDGGRLAFVGTPAEFRASDHPAVRAFRPALPA